MSHGEFTALFSDAFDDELSASDKIRFDSHLTDCALCRNEFAAYRQAIGGVRALPLAKMPVAVTLPATSPGVSWWERAVASVTRGRSLATVAGLAAAAGVLSFSLLGHTGTPARSTALAPSRAPSSAANAIAGAAFDAEPAAPRAASLPPCMPSVLTKATAPKTDTSWSVAESSSGSAHISLATPVQTVTAGEEITVFATATIPATGATASTVVAACVSFSPSAVADGLQQASTAQDSAAKAATSESAVQWHVVGESGATRITVPATARPGDVITLVAAIPQGAGSDASAPAMQTTVILKVG
jgi:hypothetical protein